MTPQEQLSETIRRANDLARQARHRQEAAQRVAIKRAARVTDDSQRIRDIRDLDGLSIRDAQRMPHPSDLGRWSEAGLFYIDTDLGVFRLTDRRLAHGAA